MDLPCCAVHTTASAASPLPQSGDISGVIRSPVFVEFKRCPARLIAWNVDKARRPPLPSLAFLLDSICGARVLFAKLEVSDRVVHWHVPEEERVLPEDRVIRRRHRDRIR